MRGACKDEAGARRFGAGGAVTAREDALTTPGAPCPREEEHAHNSGRAVPRARRHAHDSGRAVPGREGAPAPQGTSCLRESVRVQLRARRACARRPRGEQLQGAPRLREEDARTAAGAPAPRETRANDSRVRRACARTRAYHSRACPACARTRSSPPRPGVQLTKTSTSASPALDGHSTAFQAHTRCNVITRLPIGQYANVPTIAQATRDVVTSTILPRRTWNHEGTAREWLGTPTCHSR